MANYFIGGVGRVQAFINGKDGLEHYFDAKTLTDSAISISVSAEEIRGGEGAQLLGKYFHTSVFNLNMTDALFDLKYLAAQVGSEIDDFGKSKHFKTETVKIGKNGEVALSEIAVPVADDGGWCKEGATIIAWYKDCNGSEYKTLPVRENKITITNGTEGDKVCVTYPIDKDGRQIVVRAMYYPKEFVIYMTAKLFAGDACAPSKGSYVGEIVVEIPRFQLDGAVDLGLNMSSPATMQLNGSAYATGCECEEGEEPYYAKITEVMINSEDPYKNYTGIAVLESDDLHVGDKVYIYAVNGKTPKPYTGSFTATYEDGGSKNALDAAGNIVAGAVSKEVTVTITGEGALKNKTATFTVLA